MTSPLTSKGGDTGLPESDSVDSTSHSGQMLGAIALSLPGVAAKPISPARPLTPAMLRELRAIESTGEVGCLQDYGFTALAFYAREKTLTALLARELIVDQPGGYVLTDAARAAIAKATGAAHE